LSSPSTQEQAPPSNLWQRKPRTRVVESAQKRFTANKGNGTPESEEKIRRPKEAQSPCSLFTPIVSLPQLQFQWKIKIRKKKKIE